MKKMIKIVVIAIWFFVILIYSIYEKCDVG